MDAVSLHADQTRTAAAAALRAAARRIGFARLGIAAADAPLDRPRRWLDWLDAGRHAAMRYLTRAPRRRLDPRSLLPGARSLVVVQAAYTPEGVPSGLAAYAGSRDYHGALLEGLDDLARCLRTFFPAARTAPCVDTRPLLERAAARRAGLGWIGKNTMLLDEHLGPWTLLGVLVTDVRLPPDRPVRDRCGTCTRCLDACPTGAFVAPYVLDARRCLSYWTIEHRGPMPRFAREALGTRFFGCDDCLSACPFGPPRLGRSRLLPIEDEVRRLDPREAIRRLEAGFRRHFGHLAVSRAGKAGLLRNCITALAHDPRPGDVELVAPRLRHDDLGVRVHAAWALGRLGGEASRRALSAALERETDPLARREVALALARAGEARRA